MDHQIQAPQGLPIDANAALQYGALGILMVALILAFIFGLRLARTINDIGERLAKSIDRSADRMDALISTLNGHELIGERRHAETRAAFTDALGSTRHALRDDIQKFGGGIEVQIDRLRDVFSNSLRALEERVRALEK